MDEEMDREIYEMFKVEIERRRNNMMDVYLKSQSKGEAVEDAELSEL